MSIFVVTHKDIEKNIPQEYKTFAVNANVNTINADFYDNTLDNISLKNTSYCELTAIYWLWKNYKGDFVGINHYRRFFSNGNDYLESHKAKELVKSGAVILPEKEKFISSNATKYWTTSGYKSDLRVIRQAIGEYSPHYIYSYDKIMSEHSLSCYNMMVMNKEVFDSYCEWLFGILTIVESKFDNENKGEKSRRGYYKRIYGFIAERLLNVWIEQNDIETIYLPVYFSEQKSNFAEKIKLKLIKFKDKYYKF